MLNIVPFEHITKINCWFVKCFNAIWFFFV